MMTKIIYKDNDNDYVPRMAEVNADNLDALIKVIMSIMTPEQLVQLQTILRDAVKK